MGHLGMEAVVTEQRSAARRCKCGHIRPNHYHENAPFIEYAQPGVGPCHASVYTTVPMGANVSRCDCKKFEEAEQDA